MIKYLVYSEGEILSDSCMISNDGTIWIENSDGVLHKDESAISLPSIDRRDVNGKEIYLNDILSSGHILYKVVWRQRGSRFAKYNLTHDRFEQFNSWDVNLKRKGSVYDNGFEEYLNKG